MRPEDRERIQVEVVSRVVERHVEAARRSPDGYLETLVNDTLYHERQRLEHADGRQARADAALYDDIRKQMRHASDRDLQVMLHRMARRFVAEVVGNFDERVYRLSTSAIPVGLWGLLNAMSPKRLLSLEGLREGLAEQVRVEGEVEHVKALLDRGTLIVAPTHLSNLDSIILGYAVYLIGLPPLTYGAGLNLFTNPLISFFMRNLGAYRVDRKKTARLYKDVLKEYATCSLEMGYHNLFFPGGTRSRSGAIERKLKKGLLGTTIAAYINNLRQHSSKPNLYLVPCTLSYKLVLEASTLINDHLSETGQSRYIIEDDEFSRPRLIFNFLSKLLSLDARIIVNFSAPRDVLGNRVDRAGNSLDARGRIIDVSRYVMRDGVPVHDAQRDTQYTSEAAEAIVDSYLADNVILSTHVVAFAMFHLLQTRNPELDLYRLLRTGGEAASFPMREVHREVDRVICALRESEPRPKLGPLLEEGDTQAVVADALRAFGLYHTRPAVRRRGDRVFHEDRNLLLYYGNRLRGYDLGRQLGPSPSGRTL
jgi:glycerol-3-phosphate O-acyltransferase